MLQAHRFSCRGKTCQSSSRVEKPKTDPRSRTKKQSAINSQHSAKRGIMKKLGTFLSTVFVCISAALAQTSVPSAAQKAMNAIDAEKIRATVKYLSDDALQ